MGDSSQQHIWYHTGYPGSVDGWTEGQSAAMGPSKMPRVFEALRERALVPPEALHTDAPIPGSAPAAAPIDLERLRRVHSDRFLHALLSGEPPEVACGQGLEHWTAATARGWLFNCGGLLAACDAALASGGITCNLAHGYHHAGLDCARDFCSINGLAVVADALVREKRARKVLIVDLDEHEGNGTAELVIGKAPIFNLTIFGGEMKGPRAAPNNIPLHLQHEDREAGLQRDTAYLAHVAAWLPAAIRRHDPDIILYQAGADPYDGSGITPAALRVRDAYVFAVARHFERPLTWVLAGGYAPMDELVPLHLATIEQANRVLAEVHDAVEVGLDPEHEDVYGWRVDGARARFADWPTRAGGVRPGRPQGAMSHAEARAFHAEREARHAEQRLDDATMEAAYRALFDG